MDAWHGQTIEDVRRAHKARGSRWVGMTQQQLAEQIGVAKQTLAHYEVGRARLPVSMLRLLAGC